MVGITAFRILNVLLAIASIPPSLFLLHRTIKDGNLLLGPTAKVNQVLKFMFSAFSVSAIANACISVITILDTNYSFIVTPQFQAAVNLRNLLVNIGFLSVSAALTAISLYNKKNA